LKKAENEDFQTQLEGFEKNKHALKKSSNQKKCPQILCRLVEYNIFSIACIFRAAF